MRSASPPVHGTAAFASMPTQMAWACSAMGRRPAAPTPKLAFTASPAVNAWIQTGVSASAFEALGKAEGLVTLHQHRLQWVEAGVTTRAELRRVLVGSTNG